MNAKARSDLRRRTQRSFLVLGVGFLAGAGLIAGVANGPETLGAPSLLRRVLELNGSLWSSLHSNSRSTADRKALSRPPRVNGDIGLGENSDGEPGPAFDPAKWALQLSGPGVPTPLGLKLPDLMWAPPTETSAEFRCIEGWSEPVSYTGLRFSEFLRRFGLGRRSGQKWPEQGQPDDLYRYVGLETPDDAYYVSIDMESMLHPQTVLAWNMNGSPLSLQNGAPLRLLIPIKYGIKNIKRIGRITFSDDRPHDYWAEQGYDWFAGL